MPIPSESLMTWAEAFDRCPFRTIIGVHLPHDEAADLLPRRASQHLTAWEFDFLIKLQARRAAPTPKQFVILDQVLEKVRSTRGPSGSSAA